MNEPVEPGVRKATLDDKYVVERGRVFMTGTQALVRLPMLQRVRDAAAGLNTAGFISGYRGSPLGGYDLELWRAAKHLERHHVRFQPGVNEDLAATAVWGAQQVGLLPGALYDGVFGIWYGKGPGVDRSGDVFKHANSGGTSPNGGVIALAGDDHAAKSSTQAHQSDVMLIGAGMPLLYPSSVQELLDFGLHGFAMSRYSGCWVAMKVVNDVIESSASVEIDPQRPAVVTPTDYTPPPGGLNIRMVDPPLAQEERLLNHKHYAALAYCRANGLNRVVLDSPNARLGIVSAGKSYLDARHALEELGIDEARAAALGIRVLKLGMVWPLHTDAIRAFGKGLDEIVVVEEKRPIIENQIKSALYPLPDGQRPRVLGKFGDDEWASARGEALLPKNAELNPTLIVRLIAQRLDALNMADNGVRERLAAVEAVANSPVLAQAAPPRVPHFCSGCPHNRSTKVPEGSRALAGIGCHTMAVFMNRNTASISHMGGEGVMWVGQAPFTKEQHVFANVGDGTYFHSGFLAIRQAVAAKVRITYKLLYNGAVSMTGGQPVDGELSIPQIAAELKAEGVRRVTIVTDDTDKYRGAALPGDVAVRDRTELEAVQRELRETDGVTVLIYDQMCATERRRQRKRGKLPDPEKRAFINADVCEGCGDCNNKSNCLSVEPLETEFGRRRRINQSSCNKDFSCVEGFCPSFVTITGGRLKRGRSAAVSDVDLPPPPAPVLPTAEAPYGLLVTGIGGTGVVTMGAILGTAAHLDGKAVTVLDMTGLAQKYGAVMSHVRIAARPEQLDSPRIAAGEANAVLGCDLFVTAGAEALSRMKSGITRSVVNRTLTPTGDFARNPDWRADAEALEDRIRAACAEGRADFVDAARLATTLLGDAIAANLFLLGYAWQKGLVPISGDAIERAIELNGASVELNLKGFLWGRRAAHEPERIERMTSSAQVIDWKPHGETLEDLISRRVAFLTDYQDAPYAVRYRGLVERVARAERAADLGDELARTVAHTYFKLLASKDEFEVARLYTTDAFRKRLEETFEGDYRLHFHLGGGSFAKRDPVSGEPVKRELGGWMMGAFRILAGLRFLRDSLLDPFRNSAERRLDRRLRQEFESDIELILSDLSPARHALAVQLAGVMQKARGYGHVKERNAAAVENEREALLSRLRSADAVRAAA